MLRIGIQELPCLVPLWTSLGEIGELQRGDDQRGANTYDSACNSTCGNLIALKSVPMRFDAGTGRRGREGFARHDKETVLRIA
jgi:hypothetical protein